MLLKLRWIIVGADIIRQSPGNTVIHGYGVNSDTACSIRANIFRRFAGGRLPPLQLSELEVL